MEGASDIRLHINGLTAPTTFHYWIYGKGDYGFSATAGEDFLLPPGAQADSYNAGVYHFDVSSDNNGGDITLPVVDDSIVEGTEELWIIVASDLDANAAVVQADILDNDEAVFTASARAAVRQDPILLTTTCNLPSDLQQGGLEYCVEDVSALHVGYSFGPDYQGPSGWMPIGFNGQAYFPTYLYTGSEPLESFKIRVRVVGQPETEIAIEADILTGTDFQAAIAPVTEGSDAVLITSNAGTRNLEYYVEDVSAIRATDFNDPNSTSSTAWATIGANGTVAFPTIDRAYLQPARSFKVHVRAVGEPNSEIVLEADILDNDAGGIQRVVYYSYDVFNRLVKRFAVQTDLDPVRWPLSLVWTFNSYDGANVALQFDAANAQNLAHRYLWGPAVDQLLADEQLPALGNIYQARSGSDWSGSVVWPLADHLGTIRDLATHDVSTHTTSIANHRVYDSYGNLMNESAPALDEVFGFTGKLFDEATGLQNNWNRWYDPKIGKWLTEDPLGLGPDTNDERYVGNDPVDLTDATGLFVSNREPTPEERKATALRGRPWWQKKLFEVAEAVLGSFQTALPGPAPIGCISSAGGGALGGAARLPAWRKYELRFGGKQTPLKTTFKGKVVRVRLDKPPTGSRILDFKDYNWTNPSYQKPFIRQQVIEEFTEQIQKYRTISSEVHFQFSQQPPPWVIKAIEDAGGTYSVVP
jgi:RHS repeat-associated protein